MLENAEAVTRVSVLNEKECERAYQQIQNLHSQWRSRSDMIPFFTLGTASYLDAGSPEVYEAQVQHDNPVLWKHFSWLYERLKEVLEKQFQLEVVYHEKLSLPGFHIFQYHPLLASFHATKHCDTQYLMIPWDQLGVNPCELLSATLSIRLPAAGGGLNTWPVDYPFGEAPPPSDWQSIVGLNPGEYHAYHEGEMVMHRGMRFHQIATLDGGQPGDERITLQAHGIQDGDKLYVYW